VLDSPVHIAPYDPDWPARFEQERPALERVLGPSIAYLHAPHRPGEMLWFCKPDPARRTHHLHLVPTGSPRYRAELDFRDRLRSDPALAREYASLKRRLAAGFGQDRDGYTEAKGEFIRRALRVLEIEVLSKRLSEWARGWPEIRALALVGSWARGEPRLDSDLDVLVLTEAPDAFAASEEWLRELGDPPVIRREQWGPIAEYRVELQSGLEVEFDIGSPGWASTEPIDPGTREVVQGGLRILHDPDDLLTRLAVAVSGLS
jgi:GrpB-like predicted nucleotidyltransferase (UPF0157 family)